jgi:hypothetical protein
MMRAMPDTLLPFWLHWPDSELAGITLDTPVAPATLHLRFAAAFGRWAEDAGVAGYLRGVELVFHEATWQGDEPSLVLGGVAHGTLRVDGAPVGPAAHVTGLPVDQAGAVVCECRLMSGTVLRIEARRVVGYLGGEARACFRESLAC